MLLRFQLHCNRWRAYIGLGRYSEALQDAGTCCVISSQLDDSPQMIMQALCLRIESLISLGFYRDAYWFMDDLLPSCSSGTAKSVVPFYWQKCIEYYRIGEAIAGIPKSPKDCKPDADFIGPVVIKKSGKGQGRGLFATKFLKTGTVVLICKALARCHDYKSDQFIHDPMANGLVQNVEDAINQEASVDTVRLFLSFDPSSGSTSIPILPDFALEYAPDPSTSVKKIIRAYVEKLGTEGILRILRTVAFDDMSPVNTNYWMNPVENRCYHGIWLIPSLINHSCLPNASRINAGDMMSIHATKDINKGEEITIPYFNVLIPYHLRKAACRTWGFDCVCERCQLEVSIIALENPKSTIYEKILSAYFKAGPSKKNPNSGQSSIAVEAMGKLSYEVDGWLESLPRRLGERCSIWIRSSLILPYLARLQLNLDECNHNKYEENTYRKYLNNLAIVKEAVVATCPGDSRRLLLDCTSMEAYKQMAVIHPENEGHYQRIVNLNKSCDSVYGFQKPKVTKAILRKLSKSAFFPATLE